MNTLAETIVLVTGATSGVGAATVELAARRGCRVIALARNTEKLEEFEREHAGQCSAFSCDVSKADQVQGVLVDAFRQGVPDLVVNAAGIIEPLSLAECTPDRWDRTLEVNLSGTYYVARAAALEMSKAGGGSIVNVGSDLASKGAPARASYCASKAGVVGLTKALAAELAPSIRVNAVCPGPIDTPMLAGETALAQNPEAARQELIDEVPLKRLASAEEIAEAILFLGIEGRFITGAALAVDGGMTCV